MVRFCKLNQIYTRSLPHYAHLKFIIGIAIAGDTVIFGKLDNTGFHQDLPLTLADVKQRIQ
jgi:hypothetical protein